MYLAVVATIGWCVCPLLFPMPLREQHAHPYPTCVAQAPGGTAPRLILRGPTDLFRRARVHHQHIAHIHADDHPFELQEHVFEIVEPLDGVALTHINEHGRRHVLGGSTGPFPVGSSFPTASIRVVEAAETSVSGQPCGTSPRWHFKTLNNKMVELHDAYLTGID